MANKDENCKIRRSNIYFEDVVLTVLSTLFGTIIGGVYGRKVLGLGLGLLIGLAFSYYRCFVLSKICPKVKN